MRILPRYFRVLMLAYVTHKLLVLLDLTTVYALLQFIGACKEPLMVIVSELLPGMSLKSYLHSIRPSQLDTHTVISYALDIAHAMDCLHANGIIHRDLKPGKDA
jgi:serine/threonine protein kinase